MEGWVAETKTSLVAGIAAAAFILVGIGVYVASNQFSANPSNTDSHSEPSKNPEDKPDHDWEADPRVPDGKPTTLREFAEDAQAGQAPGEVPTKGEIGVITHGDLGILPPKDTGPR
ncbi:hypothetical protein NS14008_16625 [Nocardia seriolae]|nr:hypothetical protein NS14008_16625 [Nocardia seriolae]